jgi:GAF domain-containing protein
MFDITTRKLAEQKLEHIARLYALQGQINQAIVRTRERDELFRTICQVAINAGKFRLSWIGLADKTKGRIVPVSKAGFEEGYLDHILISTGKVPTTNGPGGLAFQSGKIIVCNDIAADSLMLPWKDEALSRGYRSSVAVPFRCKEKIIGVLNLYATETVFFTSEELMLLQKIGENISFALDAMDSEIERKLYEEELQKSYNLLNMLAAQVPGVVYQYRLYTDGHSAFPY